jgi:hypothetical protein
MVVFWVGEWCECVWVDVFIVVDVFVVFLEFLDAD